jgi:DNA-binding response OmpR family regulator
MDTQSIQVLLVEDNIVVALDMKRSLEKESFYITSIAKSFSKVKQNIAITRPDVAIVDINLGSKENGIEIGKYLKNNDIPIIYSTSYSDTDTISRALETDPVCYLIKPFNIEELKSNIILGVYKNSKYRLSEPNLKINDEYEYDYRINELKYKGDIIVLSKTEKKLFKVLLEANKEVVFFKDLEDRVWKNKPIKDSTLRTIVYRLRKKLPTRLVETVPNIGFKIAEEK